MHLLVVLLLSGCEVRIFTDFRKLFISI